ncbi:MAG: PD-(D/E)XK nuclease family protein [Paludibacteraceae bacterium]|nr:PD-(D/E)XK nuclease family protein [Paludibacteraceae bacterium]
MSGYLHHIASMFAHEVGSTISNYTFVFPNRRAGLFFRKALGQQLEKSIFAPRILTINECFYQLSDLMVDDELDLILRVFDIYNNLLKQQHPNREPKDLANFLFWGKMMVGDFSEIDNHLTPNVKELFTTIYDLKQIDLDFSYLTDNQRSAIHEFWEDFYKGEKQNGEINSNYTYVWSLLYPVYSELRTSLLREGLAYDGLIHREVIEHWDDIPAEKFHKRYIFIGFNALTASEEQLMLNLQKKGIADFYFDYTLPKLCDSDNRASLFAKHNQTVFQSRYNLPLPAAEEPEITWITTPSTIGQAHKVYTLLQDLAQHNPDMDLTRTAVVLPDERLLLSLLNSIPEEIKKVNVTMGYPLAATPTYALLDILCTLTTRIKNGQFYHKDVEAVLAHRYVHQSAANTCDEIVAQMVKMQTIYVPQTMLMGKSELIDAIFSITDILPYLQRVMRLMPNPESEEVNSVIMALNRIEQILHQHHITGDANTVFRLVKMMIGNCTIAYSGEPLEGLQIMGVLETRALDFDNVIITGFNDEIYPGNSRGNSFIPYILRKGFGLPTPERQDAIFAYNFYRMIGHARHVWLLTDSTADQLHTGEPSRYLHQLQYQYHANIRKESSVYPLSSSQHAERKIEKTPVVMQQIEDYAHRRGFSPTAINHYLKCPFLFYWRDIMHVEESQQIEDEMQENDFGTMIHSVLEQFYKPYLHQTLNQMPDKAPAYAMLDNMLKDDASAVIRDVAYAYLDILFQMEEYALPFEVQAVEEKYIQSFRLQDGSQVRLQGKIDRIDICNQHTRLIDYKTGDAKTEYTDIASLFNPDDAQRNQYALQTILYCLLYNKDNSAPHIYAVRRGALADTMIHKKGEESFDFSAIKEEFVMHLQLLLGEIMNPEKAFERRWDDQKCKNCAFSKLCSIG